jgi:acyl-CoA reductase-like NAD-dependent aldehyde dehydrogenase
VDGKWIGSGSGSTFAVKNPVNGSVIANVPDMGPMLQNSISAENFFD